jgi:plastocyanin
MKNPRLDDTVRRLPITRMAGFVKPAWLASIATLASIASIASMAQAAEPTAVFIKDFMFSPMSMTIAAGATVSWKNLDEEPHTVVSDTGLFRSAGLDRNDTFSYTFSKPGVYQVLCGIHPYMKETITVK